MAEAETDGDRKTAERRRVAVESARVGIWEHDLRTGALIWDQRCRELLGLAPDAEPTHADFVRALHPADRHRILDAFELAQRPGKGELDVTFRTMGARDEAMRWLVVRGRALADEQGTPVRAVGVMIEVSEEKRLTEALRAAAERAERAYTAGREAERRKDEFLAMLGHELRNPLAPILTALQLMRLKGAQDSDRERTIIERQVRHLERLVEDLLDVSRITRGKIELRRQPVELAEVLATAIELTSPLIEQKRHRLEVQVEREGLLIDADPVRLAQIATNLLANAAKYTQEGGHIAVLGKREGRDVVLRVSDDGAGIAPELLRHVFDLFTQGPQTLARAQGGLGLGLSIVRGLVEMHGGKVSARSDGAGRGSEFVVRLPALDPATIRDASTTPRTLPAFREDAPRRRILVVDDNRDATESLVDALTAFGHEVQAALDGPTALALVDTFHPDTALLDIGLPVMDGYEVAQRLRSRFPRDQLRLIAITGYGQEQDRTQALAAGFDMHLIKPVDLEILVAAIDFER